MGSPLVGWCSVARATTRAGSGRKGERQRAASAKAPRPDNRISAIAERPGGVASATMGSLSTSPLPVSLLGLPLLSQALLGDQPLLRNTRDVAHQVIQVEPRRQ